MLGIIMDSIQKPEARASRCYPSKYLDANVDLDEVIGLLCNEGTEWKINKDMLVYFKANAMKNNYKVWYHFLAARLLSMKHLSDVTKYRALLLYAIVSGTSINVG
ncbi:Uncharacterized protein TCM_039606 [Theobroma cacao]|uniref:Putative plant transposon protein domain-containing protein n=1 Tax=Theobroma cacao TaxID=3641 RepID=A0A061GRS8_THECC|nr:Uncharacterized protein TCM_039606 [Theobroma cacao]